MSNIFQRIGEAVASAGKITLVVALNPEEAGVLSGSGFKKVGTVDLHGEWVDVYEVKIQQIVNTQPHQIKVPIKDEKPSWPYNGPQWPDNKNYRLYGDSSDASGQVNYRGKTSSLVDAAYDPLSILEDYFFPGYDDSTRRKIKIEVPNNLTGEEAVNFVNMMRDEIHSRKI